MGTYVIALINGVAFGSVLFLLAAGLSLVVGYMGIINMAQGALYMVGAFVGWTVAVKAGLNFWLAVVAGGVVAGLLGLLIHQGFLRRLYKQFNEQVLLTIGCLYVLTNSALWIWGGNPKATFTAPFLSSTIRIMGWAFPISRLATIAIGAVVIAALWWFQEKTKIGAMVRAGMDDQETTEGLGINYALVSVGVFCLGAFLAGSAGVIGAQFIGASLNLGGDILLLGLAVIVLGGMGSVQGALLGAMLLGLLDSYTKLLVPQIAMYAPYIAMILVLLVRPAGLLGKGTNR